MHKELPEVILGSVCEYLKECGIDARIDGYSINVYKSGSTTRQRATARKRCIIMFQCRWHQLRGIAFNKKHDNDPYSHAPAIFELANPQSLEQLLEFCRKHVE